MGLKAVIVGGAFSDFPFDPAKYPDYFGHRLFMQYLNDYTDTFGLREHIRLNTKVLSCKQVEGGKWRVSHQEQGKDAVEEIYDALFCCTGHNTNPIIPKFPGLSGFKGEFMHSHGYRSPGRLEGKRVAIIGVGSSAVDISSEMCAQTKELHLITRRGGWIIPRYVLGQPVEAFDSRFAQTVLPASFAQWTQTKLLNFVQGKHPPALRPKHKMLEQNPTVRGDFLENVNTGRIRIHRAGVESITSTGLKLTNETSLDVDMIMSCTGYYIEMPFLPKDSYHAEGAESPNAVDLYRLVTSPRYRNLFFIGYVEIAGPLLLVAEMQARWSTAILSRRVELPTQQKMYEWISKFHKYLSENFVNSDRHNFSVFYLPYCDELARDFHVKPTFGRLLAKMFTSNPFRAFSVMNAVYMSMAATAQYRLFGKDSNSDLASATILRVAKRGKQLSKDEQNYLQSARTEVKVEENV